MFGEFYFRNIEINRVLNYLKVRHIIEECRKFIDLINTVDYFSFGKFQVVKINEFFYLFADGICWIMLIKYFLPYVRRIGELISNEF